jgi:hypothetical protein
MVPRLIFAALMLCSLGTRSAPHRGQAPVPAEAVSQHATVGPAPAPVAQGAGARPRR